METTKMDEKMLTISGRETLRLIFDRKREQNTEENNSRELTKKQNVPGQITCGEHMDDIRINGVIK